MLSDTAMWDLIVGFLGATFIIPILQQPRWSNATRALVTFLFCLVTGLITAWLTGAFAAVGDGADARTAASSVLMVMISAVSTYKGFAKPLGLAPAVESATSPGQPSREAT